MNTTRPAARIDVLLLAPTADTGARAVLAGLQRRHGLTWMLLPPARLLGAVWSHRLDPDGNAETVLRWADGAEVRGRPALLWNRLTELASALPAFRHAADAGYALAEWQALIASWLAGYGDGAVEPAPRCHPLPVPGQQAPPWRRLAERLRLATASPAPVDRPDDAPGLSVLATPSGLHGDSWVRLGQPTQRAAQALRAQLGLSLAQLDWRAEDGRWGLAAVHPLPPLRRAVERAAAGAWLLSRVRASRDRSGPPRLRPPSP